MQVAVCHRELCVLLYDLGQLRLQVLTEGRLVLESVHQLAAGLLLLAVLDLNLKREGKQRRVNEK